MVVRPQEGLNRDVHPIDQTGYKYALNAINESREGDLFAITNEQANELKYIVNGKIIGGININQNRIVVFTTSEIGLVERGSYKTLYDDECLNFDENHPVQATYRVRFGCEDTIYFTDGKNPVRYFVLTNEPSGCEDLELFRGFSIPSVTKLVQSGGQLKVGSYTFSIRYLDSDQNPTQWFLDLASVNIWDESDQFYRLIDGSFTDEVDPVYGVPATSKSIQLNIENLDQGFKFYQIAVNEYTSGTGQITRTLISPPQAIKNKTFRFTGRVDDYETGTIEEQNVQNSRVETAKFITQLENRLILANVTEKQEDWSSYQAFVNDIKVSFPVNQVPKYELRTGNPKNPDKRGISLDADEVYALSIAYVFEGGYISPFFNIPGPTPTAFDKFRLTVVESNPQSNQIALDEVRHLGLEVGDTVPRWKVRNTGYYETSNTYPDKKDCAGNLVWGDLAGRNIRHHRTPNIALYEGDNLQTIGLKLENIVYPSDNIVGHVIGYANGKTNIDKGVFFPIWAVDNFVDLGDYYIGDMEGNPRGLNDTDLTRVQNQIVFFGANRFQNKVDNGDYFHILGTQKRNGKFQQRTLDGVGESESNSNNTTTLNTRFHYYDYNEFETDEYIVNINAFDEFGVGESKEEGLRSVINESKTNSFVRYNLSSTITTEVEGLVYGALKSNVEVLDNLDAIEYQVIHDNILTHTDGVSEIVGGDTFVSLVSLENVVKENRKRNVFNAITEIEVEGSLLSNIGYQSPLNLALRISSDERCLTYFKPTFAWNPVRNTDEGWLYLFDKLTSNDGEINYYDGLCEQYMDINPDQSVTEKIRSYNTLPTTFDFCSACLGEAPNRVHYSQQSFQKETVDNYRVFLANNYRDVEAERGVITGLFRYMNNLYIHTSDALWWLPQNVQERISAEGIVSYLGSGEFFQLPPRVVKDSSSGTGGSIDPWATIKTDNGVFFVDTVDGAVFMLADQLTPIATGMRSFFEENMKNTLRKSIEQEGGTYPESPYFAGCIATYDTRHKRIIVTYKDYEPKNFKGLDRDRKVAGFMYFNNTTKKFVDFRGQEIQIGDPEWFCNKSWTLSYSLLSNRWVSFHSYRPQWYLFSKSEFYSSMSNQIWRHNKDDEYNTYYGVIYPHTIEYVSKAKQTSIWDHISFWTEASRKGLDLRWTTFNKCILYNSRQCTDEITLNARKETNRDFLLLREQEDTLDLERDDRNFYLNSFVDKVSSLDEPFFKTDCVDWSQTDKELNIDVLLGNDWYAQEPMEDKYLVCRFILENVGDVKLTTLFFQDQQTVSER